MGRCTQISLDLKQAIIAKCIKQMLLQIKHSTSQYPQSTLLQDLCDPKEMAWLSPFPAQILTEFMEGGNHLCASLFKIRALFSFLHSDWRNASLEESECLNIPKSGNTVIQRPIVLISKALKSALHPPLAELFFGSLFNSLNVQSMNIISMCVLILTLKACLWFIMSYQGAHIKQLFWQGYKDCFTFWQEQFSPTKHEASWSDLLLPPSS